MIDLIFHMTNILDESYNINVSNYQKIFRMNSHKKAQQAAVLVATPSPVKTFLFVTIQRNFKSVKMWSLLIQVYEVNIQPSVLQFQQTFCITISAYLLSSKSLIHFLDLAMYQEDIWLIIKYFLIIN